LAEKADCLPSYGTTTRVTIMAHFAWPSFDKAHFDWNTLDRVESAIMLGLIGSGLLACAIGAFIYDIGRWFSAW
jgi:hypothetical protein